MIKTKVMSIVCRYVRYTWRLTVYITVILWLVMIFKIVGHNFFSLHSGTYIYLLSYMSSQISLRDPKPAKIPWKWMNLCLYLWIIFSNYTCADFTLGSVLMKLFLISVGNIDVDQRCGGVASQYPQHVFTHETYPYF